MSNETITNFFLASAEFEKFPDETELASEEKAEDEEINNEEQKK